MSGQTNQPTHIAEPSCIEDSVVCRWVWEATDHEWLAEVSHLALVPLRLLLIILLALLARGLLHRAVNRLVRRTANHEVPAVLRPLPERVRTSVQQATTVRPERRRQRAEAIGSVLRGTITVALFTMVGLLILSEFAINLAPLLAGAGVVGVALGFGAQSLVRDVLAGVFILLEDQYGVGDVVDLGEASGVVEAIGLRITTLRDLQGVLWFVPNGEIRRVGNRSHSPAVVVVDIPIGFASVPEAIQVLREGAQALVDDAEWGSQLVEEPVVLGVDQVTVEGAVVRTTAKTSAEAQWQVARELRRRQTEALEGAGLAAQILAARVYPPASASSSP